MAGSEHGPEPDVIEVHISSLHGQRISAPVAWNLHRNWASPAASRVQHYLGKATAESALAGFSGVLGERMFRLAKQLAEPGASCAWARTPARTPSAEALQRVREFYQQLAGATPRPEHRLPLFSGLRNVNLRGLAPCAVLIVLMAVLLSIGENVPETERPLYFVGVLTLIAAMAPSRR